METLISIPFLLPVRQGDSMTAYISIDDYKVWADIKSPNQDSQINQLLEPACLVVQDYIGYTLTLDGNNDPTTPEKVFKYFFKHKNDTEILLPDMDTEISSVALFVKGLPVGTSTLPTLTEDNFHIDELASVLHLETNISSDWGVAVTYTYSNKLTDSIRLATYMLVDYWRNKDFQMVKLQGGQSVTSTPTRVLPKHIESILNASRGM